MVPNPTHGSGWIVHTQPTSGHTGFPVFLSFFPLAQRGERRRGNKSGGPSLLYAEYEQPTQMCGVGYYGVLGQSRQRSVIDVVPTEKRFTNPCLSSRARIADARWVCANP